MLGGRTATLTTARPPHRLVRTVSAMASTSPPRDAAPRVRTPLDARARLGSVVAHRETGHVAKYGVVGVANVIIDLSVFALLVHFGLWYVAARVVAVVVATVNGYMFNRIWTFRAGAHQTAKLARYVTVQGIGLLLSVGMLAFLVEVLDVPKLAAAVLALPFVAGYCFLANRLWTFGRHVPPAVIR